MKEAVLTGMDHELNEMTWAAWVDAHADKLLLFARQQARSEADAQDVVQDAVLEAANYCGTGQPPPVPLVFATIRRRAIDLARKQDRRSQRESAAGEAVATEWFDPDVADREMIQLMQTALRQIPAEQREVITLRLWGGLTFAEIARTLEVSANTAASRYRYGLEAVRRLTREVLV